MFHSDVKEMRLVSLGRNRPKYISSAEQYDIGIAGCLVQYNCPAWVSRKSRAMSVFIYYMHIYI